ncbi:hypothetical protein TSAR_016941 [Trichomalopsis sarcophagae]|uniref:Uncharacterized protein n=1 Tax=Trichomalopsis sarcophagae TaxID=543379 RepID=A0A232EHA5_9HYME|nr:hypothetical protein TSAR_016941 [Trichomalopsis sarcophagae]
MPSPPHIKYIKTRASNTLNILKAFSNKTHGKALTRSILEWSYACFSNALKIFHLKQLEAVHSTGLKICLGLPKFASNALTHNIIGKTTLSHRKNILIDRYLYKSASLEACPYVDSFNPSGNY